MSRLLRAQWVTLLGAVTVAGVVLSFLTPQFGSVFNVFTILQTAAVDAVIGLSQMLVLAVGDMSLAVGGIASLVTVVVGNLYDVQHWPLSGAVLAGLAIGALSGLLNGLITGRSGLSGFIVTLATGTAFTGVAYGITSSVPYSDIPSVLVNLSQGRASFFPYLLIVTAVTTALVGVGLYWLPAGRSLLAVGGNREAAVLSGLSRNSSLLLAHGASGLLAAIAAVMYIGVLQSATPATGGDWLIVSFAVPIIGGTALTGGEASSVGTVAAAIVLAAINDALIVLNVNTNAVEMAEGLLIFAAVLAGRFGQSAGTARSGYRRMLARQSRKQVSLPAAAGPARA